MHVTNNSQMNIVRGNTYKNKQHQGGNDVKYPVWQTTSFKYIYNIDITRTWHTLFQLDYI